MLVHNGDKDTPKTRITYQAPEAQKVYTGEATGTGDPEAVLRKRFSKKDSHPGHKLGEPKVIGVHDTKAEQRGAEQLGHEKQGANSANKKNPVGERNPNIEIYRKKTLEALGETFTNGKKKGC